MGMACLVYNAAAAAAGATNVDFAAATDSDFTQRNGHYTFTERYSLAAMAAVGASVIRGRLQSPTLNGLGELVLFGANRSATVPSNPYVEPFFSRPLTIPVNEEFQVQYSNNLGAATEVENVLLWLITEDWNSNLPQPAAKPFDYTGVFRATATVTPTANAWSGPQAISLSQSLRNGVWAIVNTWVQGTNAFAFRWVFPKYKLYQGRKLRPGGLIQNAIGDVPALNWREGGRIWGEWGRFHTFELPQIDLFGITAASITYQIFMDMVYLGTDLGLLSQGMGA